MPISKEVLENATVQLSALAFGSGCSRDQIARSPTFERPPLAFLASCRSRPMAPTYRLLCKACSGGKNRLALLADLARELSKALQHRREEYPHSLLSQCDEDLIGRADLLIKPVSRGVLRVT